MCTFCYSSVANLYVQTQRHINDKTTFKKKMENWVRKNELKLHRGIVPSVNNAGYVWNYSNTSMFLRLYTENALVH